MRSVSRKRSACTDACRRCSPRRDLPATLRPSSRPWITARTPSVPPTNCCASTSSSRRQTAAAIPALFEETPQADFNDRPVEAFLAATAAPLSYRRAPNPNASAILYINTAGLPTRPLVPAAALFLREALPGHHFQIATQEARADLPRFRRFGGDPGFVEGWGLYAASLGEELGLYRDAESKFSALVGAAIVRGGTRRRHRAQRARVEHGPGARVSALPGADGRDDRPQHDRPRARAAR